MTGFGIQASAGVGEAKIGIVPPTLVPPTIFWDARTALPADLGIGGAKLKQ